MDDAGDFVMRRNEINGNFSVPRFFYQPSGADEVDTSRDILPLGEDDTDGSPSKTSPTSFIDCLGKGKNENEDDGYYSQDPLHGDSSMPEKHLYACIQRDEESSLNNNICPPLYPCLSEDATGKVLGLRVPADYIIRSNERRTSFSPNDNSRSLDNKGNNINVQVKAISSRLSFEESRNIDNSSNSSQSDQDNITLESYKPSTCTSCDTADGNVRRRLSAGLTQRTEGQDLRQKVEAGVSISPKKRKSRDEDDGGDDTCTPYPAEPDTKRLRTADVMPRHHSQAPLIQDQPRPWNSYDIQGQANWVVEQPQNCTFHIYQHQGPSSGGLSKQHPVEWAGVNIHQVQDEDLKAAFEASSKAISVTNTLKRFARILPVSRSPTLEKELSSLESCSGSAQDKAMAVLLRWWREEQGCRHDNDVKAKLRDGLEDCGLKRVVKDLDRILNKAKL